MWSMLLAVVVTATAEAQEPPPRVDPDYYVYLEQLRALQEGQIGQGPMAQLDWGVVGMFYTRGGTYAARVDVRNIGPQHYHEQYFFLPGQTFHPAREFSFVYEEEDNLTSADFDHDYEDLPYILMDCYYVGFPPAADTLELDYQGDVDRWTFELWQDDGQGQEVVVGHLLREHHRPPFDSERYFDHWVLRDAYAVPDDPGDRVDVRLAPTQHASTATFFAALQGNGPYKKVTHVEYVVGYGSDASL